MAEAVRRGEVQHEPWSTGRTQSIQPGDRLFLLRQRVEPKGIVASGWADSASYEDDHYDPDRAARGDKANYVKFRFDKLVDPDQQPDAMLSTELLNELIPGLNTSTQSSGTQIPEDLVLGIEQLWRHPERMNIARDDVFPPDVTRQDALDAIAYFEQHGLPQTYSDSTFYDLVHEGHRYPPKVIAGLAVRRVRGRMMLSQEFSGGVGKPCFQMLEELGFSIEPKPDSTQPVSGISDAQKLTQPGRRYWWVNQNQTYKAETEGGYLWSPKRKSNGARNPFYETMREVSPGDLILSFRDTRIPAIGVAQSNAYEAAKPDEFGNAGDNWDSVGWRVEVDYQTIEQPIRPKDHIADLRPIFPERYAPLTTDGDGKQAVYLTELPEPLFVRLMELALAEEGSIQLPAPRPVERIARDEIVLEAREAAIERAIESDTTIPATEREQITKARVGQGKFKENVAEVERSCRITNLQYLIASHIKPWRDSNNQERLSGHNGLLLARHADHLFDRGYITFSDEGALMISPVADQDVLSRLHIPLDGSLIIRPFSDEQKAFLSYHRREIFLQSDRG